MGGVPQLTEGQPFHLLLGLADWGGVHVGDPRPDGTLATLAETMQQEPPARGPNTPEWDEPNAQLTLALRLDALRGSATDTALDPAARRAAAADANGNIYWIGADRTQLYVRSAGDGSTGRFWPDPRAIPPAHALFVDAAPSPATATPYQALAVTADSYLAAASASGVDAFDLIAGGPPAAFRWPAGFAPTVTDLEPRGMGLWLLDGPARRLYELDSSFALCGSTATAPEPDLFTSANGTPRPARQHASVTGHDLSLLAADITPIAIAPLSANTVAILSRAPAAILLLNTATDTLLDHHPLDFLPFDMVVGDVLLRGGDNARRLCVSGGSGNQLRTWQIKGDPGAETLFATTETIPLRRYNGLALLTVLGNVSYDSGAPNAIAPDFARAVEQPRQLYAASARLIAGPFDARLPQTIWDRLHLDGCIPPGSEVHIEARCGDDPAQLGAWVAQPAPLLSPTGAELAGHAAASLPATDLRARRGTFELLLQGMAGRYLELRLTLTSDGNTSPHLRCLRIAYPRVSWAQSYLPAVYRADPTPGSGSADFLDRFLANMQGTFAQLEARIAAAQVLLDARTVPADALPWLADWFDVALDPSWGEARARAFVAHALRFFGWRGTIRGLESALALAFGQPLDATLFGDGDCTCANCLDGGAIRIIETYRTRTTTTDLYASGLAEQARWLAFQQQRGTASPLTTLPRLAVPASHIADWAAFVALASPDRLAWQRLLLGRYRRIARLNTAHGSAWGSFEEVALAAIAPATTTALADWTQFATQIAPMRAAAHRFTVLLPIAPGEATDTATLGARTALAARIIALEKPAHTTFDIRFYFAANRIGEARLGLDTAIGAGSRAPELLTPAILGRAYAGESFIGGPETPPPDRALVSC